MASNDKAKSLLEYISFDTSLSEQGEDDEMQGQGPDMGGGMPGGDPEMGGDPMDGGMPGGDPGMGGDPMGGGQAAPPEGFAPQGQGQDMGEGLPGMDGGPDAMQDGQFGQQQPGDEVIDVDDLTDSQEDTEKKIDVLSSKFSKLIDKLTEFEEKIEGNDRNIESLKAELEKRNPTPVEKMTLRSKNAYPFNVAPEEYWADKEATSNYSTEDDNNGADDEVYKITKSDIDDISDWPEISKTLNTRNGAGLLDILDF